MANTRFVRALRKVDAGGVDDRIPRASGPVGNRAPQAAIPSGGRVPHGADDSVLDRFEQAIDLDPLEILDQRAHQRQPAALLTLSEEDQRRRGAGNRVSSDPSSAIWTSASRT